MVRFNYSQAGGGASRCRGAGVARVRPGGSSRPSVLAVKDARFKIISKKRSGITDARDMLVKLAKTTDARQKLQKIRNLKQGKLDEKKTKRGAITITTTTKGNLLLTTNKKTKTLASPAAAKRNNAFASAISATTTTKVGNLTRRIGQGGTLSISTRKPAPAAKAVDRKKTMVTKGGTLRTPVVKSITRTIKGELSAAAKLDEELLNTHVDPVILKRTIKQSVRQQSPPTRRYVPTRTMSPDNSYDSRRRERSRSPIDMVYEYDRGYSSLRAPNPPLRRRAYNDYDDPRRSDEDEGYRRRLMRQNEDSFHSAPRTMADRLDSGSSSVSPLQGAKIVVSNLQNSVSQEDIMELFGDIGALKRAKIVEQGTAEVVFVTRSDALKAVEIYHNRQLDGKAMKCQIVGASAAPNSSGGFRLPSQPSSKSSVAERQLHPEMSAIHRALFNEKTSSGRASAAHGGGTKPLFTVTMPKKGGR